MVHGGGRDSVSWVLNMFYNIQLCFDLCCDNEMVGLVWLHPVRGRELPVQDFIVRPQAASFVLTAPKAGLPWVWSAV